MGALDLVIVYLPAGNDTDTREQRLYMMNQLKASIAPNNEVLTIMMGDWNFVREHRDRFSFEAKDYTGKSDQREAKAFEKNFIEEGHFVEWEQEYYTHENGLARSKLDRHYSNHALFDQLDRNYDNYALPHKGNSDHRPVAFSRTTAIKEKGGTPTI